MAKIILDFGSGNTCKNDFSYVEKMIDGFKSIDTGKHEVVIKWQLFKEAGKNIPLLQEIFNCAYEYGRASGYQVTASVFDKESLDFLLEYDIPFVKIANNRSLDWLINEIPRKIPVYVSIGDCVEGEYYINPNYISLSGGKEKYLFCVSEYPAQEKDYNKFPMRLLKRGISDHTTDFQLWHKYQPEIIEWHYKLKDSTGLDAGPFARTPEQLKEVL